MSLKKFIYAIVFVFITYFYFIILFILAYSTPHPRSSCILASFRLCAAIMSHGSGSLGAPVAGCPPSLLPGHRSPSGCSPCQVWATDSPPLFALLTSPILWQPVSSLKYCHLNPIPLPTRSVAHKPSHRDPPPAQTRSWCRWLRLCGFAYRWVLYGDSLK